MAFGASRAKLLEPQSDGVKVNDWGLWTGISRHGASKRRKLTACELRFVRRLHAVLLRAVVLRTKPVILRPVESIAEQPERDLVPISVRVDADLHARFRLAAAHNNRKMSDEVRHLIKGRVEEFEAQITEAA